MASSGKRDKLRFLLISACLISFCYHTAAAPGRKQAASSPDLNATTGSLPDSVAGPIVRAVVDRLKDANDTDVATKKKTIAQIIEVALEQEFPEAKEEAFGKNYNETAKLSDVRTLLSAHRIHLLTCTRSFNKTFDHVTGAAGHSRDSFKG